MAINFDLFSWFEDMLKSFAEIGQWLTTPINEFLPSPLTLTLASGLIIYLGIAITKWFTS